MSQDNPPVSPSFFSQMDVSPDATGYAAMDQGHTVLLREILAGQQRQNELLEELISLLGTNQRQRANELAQWRKANPDLAGDCRRSAELLGRVQAECIRRVTEEVEENGEALADGEFMLNEFVDRFGARLPQLHNVLQMLSQLGGNPASEEKSSS